MRVPFGFEEYLKKGVVKERNPDKHRALDLKEESERKFNSLNVILDKIGISDENANDILEYCYDIIINLIRSEMLLKGLNASGKGAHESEIAYMREMGFSETDIGIANQLRYFRNGIMYYGKRFDEEYAKKIIKFLKKVRGKIN